MEALCPGVRTGSANGRRADRPDGGGTSENAHPNQVAYRPTLAEIKTFHEYDVKDEFQVLCSMLGTNAPEALAALDRIESTMRFLRERAEAQCYAVSGGTLEGFFVVW